jgi:hypothetical protein
MHQYKCIKNIVGELPSGVSPAIFSLILNGFMSYLHDRSRRKSD